MMGRKKRRSFTEASVPLQFPEDSQARKRAGSAPRAAEGREMEMGNGNGEMGNGKVGFGGSSG